MSLSVNEGAAMLIAICFAAGLNVYATVATLGLLARSGFLELPGSLDVVTSWWVIGAGGVMFVVEFFADKIPVFDLVWNALQTVIRVPAGAILAYAASTELGLGWQLLAATGGGTISFVAHGWKTTARAAATTSPEPASNLILSLTEDAVAIFITWFATQHPYLAAAIVLVLIALIVLSIRWMVRVLKRFWQSRKRAAPA
jgi:Domain of unknown function (DUF4126)